MTRTPGRVTSTVERVTADTTSDMAVWLAQQMDKYELPWLLAVTNESIVWGELRTDGLHLSTDASAFPQSGPAILQWQELQQCRCFGAVGELFVWVGPSGPSARLRLDSPGDTIEHLDEDYQLWGEGRELRDGFVRLLEGEQGITHCPPLGATVAEGQRANLRVRHYLGEDGESGATLMIGSRLVDIAS